MKFIEFLQVFGDTRLIDMRNVSTCFNGLDRRRLYEWQKRGLILKVTRNFYLVKGKHLDEVNRRAIASVIYAPAYVALESALAYYNFIPEAVFCTVCMTTRRNRKIRTPVGDFQYRSIKPGLFFGARVIAHDHDVFYISDPEKTLLDHFYFTPEADNKDVLAGMRLNLEEIRRVVDVGKLRDYVKLFASAKVSRAVHQLMEMAHIEFQGGVSLPHQLSGVVVRAGDVRASARAYPDPDRR